MTSQMPSSNHFDNAAQAVRTIFDRLQDTAQQLGDTLVDWTYPAIEQGTAVLGQTVAPLADSPFLKFATAVPGVNWLLAALGQVNTEAVRQEVAALRQRHPLDTDEQLAQRVITDWVWRAAQVGLLTNLLPPFALFLMAVDIGAIAALQAEMIYRIATIYGFAPEEATRRGEVLAIWGISTGSTSVAKSGLSIVELLPVIGATVGITSDAAILCGVGFLSCRYYETKKVRQPLA